MTFETLTILTNCNLDRNKMKDRVLYLFKSNENIVAAWLEKGDLKLKKVDKK